MSLDVYLSVENPVSKPKSSGIFIREAGAMREISRAEWDERFPDREPAAAIQEDEPSTEVYSANITHNLGKMAKEAGIYQALWRPEEIGVTTAGQLIPLLTDGLAKLQTEPEKFKAFNPENGWGNYDGLVSFVADYRSACLAHPNAKVSVCR